MLISFDLDQNIMERRDVAHVGFAPERAEIYGSSGVDPPSVGDKDTTGFDSVVEPGLQPKASAIIEDPHHITICNGSGSGVIRVKRHEGRIAQLADHLEVVELRVDSVFRVRRDQIQPVLVGSRTVNARGFQRL